MRIHKLHPPTDDGVHKCGGTSDDLDEIQLEQLGSNITEMWYWYTGGGYDGVGYILTRNERGLFTLHNAGHCSCYGPCDDFDDKDACTLGELLNRCRGFMAEWQELYNEAARKYPVS